MDLPETKTFWDIEEEKTWRIYAIFGFLVLLYLLSVFVIWMIVKSFLGIRHDMFHPGVPFRMFGPDLFVVLGLALVAALIHWYYSHNHVVDKILVLLGAKQPDKHDKYHYVFQNIVDEIEASVGGQKVERCVLPTGALNAFAVADLKGRQVIGVTEGLLSRLKRDELQAVVAHEMAHIVSKDSLMTTVTCSLFNIYTEALSKTMRWTDNYSYTSPKARNALALSMVTAPILMVMLFTDMLSWLLKMFISREREYRADAAAVKFTRHPESLARALYKIGSHWRGAGSAGEYLSPIFILSPQLNPLSEQDNFFAALFSTHPPLTRRLQIILDLAHTDLFQIIETLEKTRRIKTEPSPAQLTPRFYAEHDNEWVGPFTLVQLQTLDWLEPHTNLRVGGSNEVIKAGEFAGLSFFFQKRNEPLWKIKRLCPICRQWLLVQEYEGAYVWQCACCNGVLIEQDKLPRIIVRTEKGFMEDTQHTAQLLKEELKQKNPRFRLLINTPHQKPCPKCGKPMTRKFYSYAYHVEIDECPQCKLVWFDTDELEILQCLIEMEDTKPSSQGVVAG